MEQPNIEINGEKYYQVGCKKCQQGDYLRLYFNAKTCAFLFKCDCGHTVKIDSSNVKEKPDMKGESK